MKNKLKEYAIINFGIILVAITIHFFMIPNNFVVGGVSGLAIVITAFIPILSVGDLMFILNIILFIAGFIFIGPKFGARTIYSSFALSFIVWLLNKIYPISEPLMNDTFVQLVVSIIIGAIGLAIVFKYNASTGGTDITAKILNKYFHIDLGKGVLMCDLLITVSAFVVFDVATGIYGILGVVMNGIIIDYILEKFKERKEITIISDKCDQIKEYIIYNLERGVTIFTARGGYTDEEKDILVTVLNRKEFIRLKTHIKEIDSNAFITVNNIHETFGYGFVSISD